MGIFDSFKKVLGGNTEAGANEISITDGESADKIQTETKPVQTEQAEEVAEEKGCYTVRSGDTLWSIAQTVYGDGSRYSTIFDANTGQLEHPEQIFPGQELLIPDLDDQDLKTGT